MRCNKCKYTTNTICQCQFGYEQASKEFLDGNCEKFVDKYKEEYTPIIAREISENIKVMSIDFTKKSQQFEFGYRFAIQEILAELKKYIGE